MYYKGICKDVNIKCVPILSCDYGTESEGQFERIS